jgi:phosphoenolpyruvate carboxylase
MMSVIAPYRDRLRDLHQRTAETPIFNPVFQLSLDISRDLEGGKISLSDVDVMIAELECEALQSRATKLKSLLAPVDEGENITRFRALVEASAIERTCAEFAGHWSKPFLHAVFTGHPTFLLSMAQAEAVALAASSNYETAEVVCAASPERAPITLEDEHDQAMTAITRAGIARDQMVRTIMEVAAQHWPNDWQNVRPIPFRLASWVGYDMDGRTDIGWVTSIRFRLIEKQLRLDQYVSQLAGIWDSPKYDLLTAAADHTREMAGLFSSDLSDPAALSNAANRLTEDAPGKILSLSAVIEALEVDARNRPTKEAITLLAVAAAMRADGLGTGWIHFRVNSSQLHNAIRRRIDPDNALDLSSRNALKRIRALIDGVKPLRSNFAALSIETITAVRQFLAMAQILNHIDGDAPIRMLIAECEEPQTVLAALYFANLFGIADRVDVSPLFETEGALEHGGRFLDALLAEPSYQKYVRTRGRVCIQTGFSDAGRFVGQLPAALAIERLQGRLARSMAANELTGVAALIFNTHGESMGRGAHPSSMTDRLRYPMAIWARSQFAGAGISTEIEASFQGGDGYLFFKTPQLALATLTRIAEVESQPLPTVEDPFYARTDLSLDFYRGIRRVQRDYLASRTYARAITSFGLGMLNETGSRKSRRQSDLAADREMSLRQIRAIPHNAILQQLGYPVNIIAGAGTAAFEDVEGLAELILASDRGLSLMRMLRASNTLASIKSVAAYGELFNSAYWASRPYRGTETHLEAACLALAEHLTSDDRNGVFRRLASRLRVDALKLHRLLNLTPDERPAIGREDTRRSLGVLHAIRLALMQHMFLRAVQIPAFSRSNDVSRQDVLEMILTLRVDEAVAQLRRAYPVSEPTIANFDVQSPTDYPDAGAATYEGIQANYIDPIAQANDLALRISTAIANHFGAHG